MNELLVDELHIEFNERTEKFSLWLNGKIIKMAANKSTLEAFASKLIKDEGVV